MTSGVEDSLTPVTAGVAVQSAVTVTVTVSLSEYWFQRHVRTRRRCRLTFTGHDGAGINVTASENTW